MTNLNIKQSLSLSSTLRFPANAAARDPSRATFAPAVPQRDLTLNVVTDGFSICNIPLVDPEPSSHTAVHAVPPATVSPPPNLQAPENHHKVAELLARQRVVDKVKASRPKENERKSRTCRKCAQPLCKGRQRVSNCMNPCQDCGRIDCKGRNTHRPEKPCYEGWQ